MKIGGGIREEMGPDGGHPLFESKAAMGRIQFRCFAASVFVGIIFIFG